MGTSDCSLGNSLSQTLTAGLYNACGRERERVRERDKLAKWVQSSLEKAHSVKYGCYDDAVVVGVLRRGHYVGLYQFWSGREDELGGGFIIK